MRYTCILLITVLMFSPPLSSLAETNDPEVIKPRAKEDANRDVSRLRWFGSGVGIMEGTRPLDNDEIRSLGLEGGLNFRWQYTINRQMI